MRLEKENILPASPNSAADLYNEMSGFYENLGFSPELRKQIEITWVHERKHFDADEGKNKYGGEFGYHAEVKVDLTSGLILASWVAYYIPRGPDINQDPERWMRIAEAPDNPSDRDRKVYDMAFKGWLKLMLDKKLKSEKESWEKRTLTKQLDIEQKSLAPKVIDLISIPRLSGESEEDYIKRKEFVIFFGKQLDLMMADGKIPQISEISNIGITNFLNIYRDDLKEAIIFTLKEIGKDNKF